MQQPTDNYNPVYSFLVNEEGEINIIIPFEGNQEAMKFTLSDPKWKPGSIVRVDEEMLDSIVGQMRDYAQTGIAPVFGSEKTKH